MAVRFAPLDDDDDPTSVAGYDLRARIGAGDALFYRISTRPRSSTTVRPRCAPSSSGASQAEVYKNAFSSARQEERQDDAETFKSVCS
ncbi:hypothetical protein ACTPOK_01910 [Streptomyces inhibens]|uniref:hypothetical protein n=1 Tax=Streptomyces inhibens TaxID=2293571 RepID=UPI00402AADEE